MINISEVIETNQMIEEENLDVRTITMGISLLDCAAPDVETLAANIYDKICLRARDLVPTGEAIAREYGVPVIAQLPIDQNLVPAADQGMLEAFKGGFMEPFGMAIANLLK